MHQLVSEGPLATYAYVFARRPEALLHLPGRHHSFDRCSSARGSGAVFVEQGGSDVRPDGEEIQVAVWSANELEADG